MEISKRALKSISLKLAIPDLEESFKNKQISDKLLDNVIYWINNNFNNEFYCKEEAGIISLEIMLISVRKVSSETIERIRNQGVINLLTNLSTFQPFKEISEEIIQLIVIKENNKYENIINSSKISPQNQNIKENTMYSSKIIPQNQNNNTNNFKVRVEESKIIQKEINLITEQSSILVDNKIVISNELPINELSFIGLLNNRNSFPEICLNSQDEQYIFDLNITLKFGDPSQISKCCNLIFYQVMNDYPIEYFLQNCELIKSILMMVEKTTCLDYGIILFKILQKFIHKLEQKIKFFKDLNMKISKKFKGMNSKNYGNQGFSSLYPTIEKEHSNNISKSKYTKQYENKLTPSMSIRDFCLQSIDVLIFSCYEIDKISLNLNLIEDFLEFIKKIIFDYDENEDWKAIFSITFKKLNSLILYLHQKHPLNYNLLKLKSFYFKLFSHFNVTALRELLESIPTLLDNLKDVLFISENSISVNSILEKLNELVISDILKDKILSLKSDYENSEIIRKSISICKRFSDKYIKLDKTAKEDFSFILCNFSNILLASEFNDNANLPLVKILCDMWESSIENNISSYYEKIAENIIKILSIPNEKTKIKIYSALSEQISFKPDNSLSLILHKEEIYLLFFNDLACNDKTLELKCLDFIIDSILQIINKNVKARMLNYIGRYIPSQPSNFKITSINLKLDSFNFNEKFLKYTQYLFSKDEQVRLNALNYFKLNYSKIENKLIEFYDLSSNEIKKVDPMIAIQSAENDFNLLLKNINHRSTDLEIMPLLNIILSNKMEANLKTSALSQIILLLKSNKKIFCEELFDHLKNEFLNTFIKYNKKFSHNALNNIDFEYYQKIGNDVLTYLSNLLRVFNIILFFYHDHKNIKQFLSIKEHFLETDLFIFVSGVIPLLFSKHTLASQAILFLSLFTFSCYNLHPFIKDNIQMDDDDHNINTIPVPKIFQKYYQIPFTKRHECTFKNPYVTSLWKKFTFNNYIVNHINFKDTIEEKILPLIKTQRGNLVSYLNNILLPKDNVFNFFEIYINCQNLFLLLISTEDSLQLKEQEIIVNFLKKILPLNKDEKNILIDLFSMINLYFQHLRFDINEQQTKNNVMTSADEQFTRNIIFISENLLNNVRSNKKYLEELDNSSEENETLIIEIVDVLEIIYKHFPKLFSSSLSNCQENILKFIQVYSSLIVLNDKYIRLRNKIVNLSLILLECDISDENFIISMTNNIEFFLTKIDEENTSFKSYAFINSCLIFINRVSKLDQFKESLNIKTYSLIKYLNSRFEEQTFLTWSIFNSMIGYELFQTHPSIFDIAFDLINDDTHYFLKLEVLNFVNNSLIFILKNKDIETSIPKLDNRQEELKESGNNLMTLNDNNKESNIIDEFIICIEKNFQDEAIIVLIHNLAFERNYLFINQMLSIFNSYLKIFENKSHFFFFETNYLEIFSNLLNIAVQNLIYIKTNFSLNDNANLFYYSPIFYTNKQFLKENHGTCLLEILIFYIEGITLLMRSFKLDKQLYFAKYCALLSNIFENYYTVSNLILDLKFESFDAILIELSKNLLTFYINFFYLNEKLIIEIFQKNSNLDKSKFIKITYKLLKIRDDFELKICYSKLLPYLFELIKETVISPEGNKEISLENEDDIIIELMTAFKITYNIKVENYNSKVNFIFDLNLNELKQKSYLMNAISTLLLISQKAKTVFMKSNMINVFIDYLKVLFDKINIYNIKTINSNPQKENKIENKNSTITKKSMKTANFNESLMTKEIDRENKEVFLDEIKAVFILLQNFFYNNKDKENIFCIIYHKLDTFQKEKEKVTKITILLYEIFYDCTRNNEIFKEYLKLLLNCVSESDSVKKSFIIPIHSEKELFINYIIDFLSKNLNNLSSNPNSELIFKLLRSLFRNKAIILHVIRTRFLESILKEIDNLFNTRKVLNSNAYQTTLLNALQILIPLSFDIDSSKKIANKEFLSNITGLLIKSKNESLIYNILFLLRNFAFNSTNKLHFLFDENPLSSILALLSSTSVSMKIQFMISHLIWVLLYNNNTLKAILNKNEFKNEIQSIHLHLQKELDSVKYLKNEEESKIEMENIKYIEDTTINFQKILHILEMN